MPTLKTLKFQRFNKKIRCHITTDFFITIFYCAFFKVDARLILQSYMLLLYANRLLSIIAYLQQRLCMYSVLFHFS